LPVHKTVYLKATMKKGMTERVPHHSVSRPGTHIWQGMLHPTCLSINPVPGWRHDETVACMKMHSVPASNSDQRHPSDALTRSTREVQLTGVAATHCAGGSEPRLWEELWGPPLSRDLTEPRDTNCASMKAQQSLGSAEWGLQLDLLAYERQCHGHTMQERGAGALMKCFLVRCNPVLGLTQDDHVPQLRLPGRISFVASDRLAY
jgi:hypothetical protein